MIYTYNPKEVDILIGDYKMTGVVSISVNQSAKRFRVVKGTRGFSTRVKDGDTSATITIEVLQTSLANNVLSGIHDLDNTYGTGRIRLSIQDNSGATGTKTLFETDSAFIEGFPDIKFTKEAQNRVWVMHCTSSRNIHVGSGFKPAINLF